MASSSPLQYIHVTRQYPLSAMGEATLGPMYDAREDESTSNTFNTPLAIPWEQFGYADQPGLLYSFDPSSSTEGISGQTGVVHSPFTLDDHISSRDFSIGFSLPSEYNTAIYFPRPATPSESPADANCQPRQLTNDKDNQYQAHHSEECPTPTSIRRRPPRDDAIRTRAGRNKEESNANGNYESGNHLPPSTQQSDASRTRQNRNKITSKKFRAKTRVNTRNLECQEQNLEDINQDLIDCVTDLKYEVYKLKMQLLHHGLCDYNPIQAYIASEAKRFVNQLEQEEGWC